MEPAREEQATKSKRKRLDSSRTTTLGGTGVQALKMQGLCAPIQDEMHVVLAQAVPFGTILDLHCVPPAILNFATALSKLTTSQCVHYTMFESC